MKPFRDLVERAFLKTRETHGDVSPDDVVIKDELNSTFINACLEENPGADEFDLNKELLDVRKSGHIGKSAKRKTNRVSHIDYIHAAEIATRLMEDKHKLTIDRVLCHPDFRKEFDAAALKVTPGISPYLLRKAALSLRKTRRLKPELINRIVSDSWGKKVNEYPASELENDHERIPTRPGVYIFRDDSGYLYIGQADNLRKRLSKHLNHSDRKTLAHYFWENGKEKVTVQIHAFSADSEGSKPKNRSAYEAELIRSRKPKFNIQGRETNP